MQFQPATHPYSHQNSRQKAEKPRARTAAARPYSETHDTVESLPGCASSHPLCHLGWPVHSTLSPYTGEDEGSTNRVIRKQ